MFIYFPICWYDVQKSIMPVVFEKVNAHSVLQKIANQRFIPGCNLFFQLRSFFFFALHSSFSACLSIALLRLHHMWTIKGEYKFRLSLSALILIDHFCHFSLFFQSTIGLFREMTYTHSSILSLNGDHFCSEIIPCYDNVIIDFVRGNILFNKQRLDKIVSFDFDGRLVCCTLQ